VDPTEKSTARSTAEERHGTVEQVVTITFEDYGEVVREASAHGVQLEKLEERNLVDPASASVILIGTSLAVSTVLYLIEQRKGGQVFDLRPGAQRPAYRSPDITYGYVQIIATDGSVSVEVKEPKGMFGQVLDTLSLIVRESIGSARMPVKSRVEDALGDAVSVTTDA
jgi:hypothetical protein